MPPRLKSGSPVALPEFILPELATLTDKAPPGDGWIHEIKLDGYRTAARLESGKVRMLTRSGLDWTARRNACQQRASPPMHGKPVCRLHGGKGVQRARRPDER